MASSWILLFSYQDDADIVVVLEGGQFLSDHHNRWLLHFVGRPEIRQSIIQQLDSLSQKAVPPEEAFIRLWTS